jgi:uncharacterized protein (DUF2336 family)
MPRVGTNITHLLRLAQDRSEESTAELVTMITDLFENESDILTDREKNLMYNIIETLFHEVEVSIRRDLSQQLADRDDVPHELIMYLANDKIQVAEPVLSKCELLQDTDLIKIIHQRTEEYHMAITLRRDISEDVSDALVETGSEEVIVSLLNNKNSNISQSTMDYLVEQSERVDTFQEPLIHHRDLNSEMAERLYGWVSDALRQDISSKFDLPTEVISKFFNKGKWKSVESAHRQKEAIPDATRRLIEQLKSQEMITADVLIAALSQGEIPLFIGLFSEMTQLDMALSKDIIFDGNEKEVAVACKAFDATELQFVTILKKARKLASSSEKGVVSPKIVNETATFYRTVSREEAIKAVGSWTHSERGM